MKNKGEKILEKAFAKESINLYEVFEILMNYNIIISKELTNQIKTKVVAQSLLKIKSFEEIAQASALKSIIKNIKDNFKIIGRDLGPEIKMPEIEILKKNIIAILTNELNLMIKSDEDKKLPKIQINCETTVLYALFEQLNKEIFIGDNLHHRISQIISQNFIGKDQNNIDQKTSYNKLKIGATERANKNLNLVLERISKKIK